MNRVVTRRCVNPTYLKEIYIPTDTTIAVDVLSLHYDPELWGPEDPNTFYPLRFVKFKIFILKYILKFNILILDFQQIIKDIQWHFKGLAKDLVIA